MSENARNLYGVNFLVSLLTRFPELNEAEILGKEKRIKLSIDFYPEEDPHELFYRFQGQFEKILRAFSLLEPFTPTRAGTEIVPLGKGWWKFSISIAIHEVQLSFFILLIDWWKEFFKDCKFNSPSSDPLNEDEIALQEEIIENTLQALQSSENSFHLKGLKENDQVIVFQKPPLEE